jgi:UDP-N-acetylglucosamine:LPS N-acetylglucosamine transferase
MGGYVSFPGGMMAALRGIPLVLHEQNSVAGLANRVLAGVADRVMTGFPGAFRKGPLGRQSGASRKSPCCQRRLSGMPHTMARCGCWWSAAASVPRP